MICEPYTWPCDGPVQAWRTGVVLAGPQRLFVTDGMGREVSLRLRECILPALADRRFRTIALFFEPRACMGRGLTASPEGMGLAPGFEAWTGDISLYCPRQDAFFGTGLDLTLRVLCLTHLVFCGFGLETVLHSTLRSANDRGYECLTLSDGCAALDARLAPAALKTVTMSGGIFGAVAPSTYLTASRGEQ